MALTAGVPMELVRRVTGHSTVDVVLKHYFRPRREAFRTALETALPRTLTGEVETKKSPAEQLEELAEKVDDLEREQLAEEILRIAGLLAA